MKKGNTPEGIDHLTVLLASRKVMVACNSLVVACLENNDVLPPRYEELLHYVELFIRKQDLNENFNFKKDD